MSLPPTIRLGLLEFDLLRRTVRVDGVAHQLTGSTLGLLYLLGANIGRVLTREEIASALWRPDRPPASNAVDRMVLLLRRRLDDVGEPRMVQTVAGRGYRLVASPD